MRPIDRFRHLMSSTILLADRTGIDTYGTPTFGPDRVYKAHIRGERRLIRDSGGQAVGASLAVYLAEVVNVHPTARVTLSTGDVGSTDLAIRQPPIVAVDRAYDETGLHHIILRLE